MRKCIFLDRDGVLNKEIGDYVYTPDKLHIIEGVREAISHFKESGFLVIVITNQAGIAKGIYSREQMHECHRILQDHVDHGIDKIYYSPFHDSVSASLSRKPGTLMFERALAKYTIDPAVSWMIGDKERDLIPAKKLGIRTIFIGSEGCEAADFIEKDLFSASVKVLDEFKKQKLR